MHRSVLSRRLSIEVRSQSISKTTILLSHLEDTALRETATLTWFRRCLYWSILFSGRFRLLLEFRAIERETSRWHRRQASMWHYRKRRCTSPFSIRSFLSPYATVLVSTTVGSKFFLAVSFFCLFFIERKWSNTHTRRQESESMNSTRSADKQREREKETIPWPNDRETKWQFLYQDVGARLL